MSLTIRTRPAVLLGVLLPLRRSCCFFLPSFPRRGWGRFFVGSLPTSVPPCQGGKQDNRIFLKPALAVLLGVLLVPVWLAAAQDADAQANPEMDPLAVKEEMIRDRFKRFEDRVFRLREQLSEIEPANAKRLARVLDRAGELQLGDRLEEIVKLLDQANARGGALEEQGKWLADAERVLGILLERDSDNEARRDEIDKMRQFKEDVDQILQQQRELRSEAAQTATARQMAKQLEQALQRIQSLLRDQQKLPTDDASKETRADDQRDLARDADDLADDLKSLADTAPPEEVDSESLLEARQETGKASESTKAGAEAMARAAQELRQGKPVPSADQQEAVEKLEEAQGQIEKALEQLREESQLREQAQQQEGLSDETKELGNRMREDGSPHGGPQQKGTPGQEGLDEAQKEMDEAQESLEQDQPDEAIPDQDRAIEELKQAQKELDEALKQLRKEERAEMLRDLEVRFRQMLSKQRAINELTVVLDQFGRAKFTRAEELQLADLAMKQQELSEDASACLNILDEDGTTVVFPRVVEQVAGDMTDVADRLAELLVGALTQQVEQDIVDALEQLLGAVQKMQQENEQQEGSGEGGDSENQSLLPTSAELKLLRSSQQRVNKRTTAIESAKADPAESPDELKKAAQGLADRQKELSAVATEMRDRQNQP